MTLQPEEQWLLPAGMKHQLGEAKELNQLILQYLNRYPSPVGVNANMVSSIRHKLDELQRINQEIAAKSAGWLDRGEG